MVSIFCTKTSLQADMDIGVGTYQGSGGEAAGMPVGREGTTGYRL